MTQLVLTCWVLDRIREGRVPPARVLRRWWMDPDSPPPRLHRRGRPETGVCVKCGDVFVMNPFGRPATKCERHRRSERNPRKDNT